jgi:VanZ family protein
MAIIFMLSSVPGNARDVTGGYLMEFLNPRIQDILHIPLFAILALLWIITFRRLEKEYMCIRMTLLISLSYAFIDEIHQYFVPGRYMSLRDVLLNSLGILFSVWFYQFYMSKMTSTVHHFKSWKA